MWWFSKMTTVIYLTYSGYSPSTHFFVSFASFPFWWEERFSQRDGKGLKVQCCVTLAELRDRNSSEDSVHLYSPSYFCLFHVVSTVNPELVWRIESVKGLHWQSRTSTLEPRVLEAKTWNLKKRNFRHKYYFWVTNTTFSQFCK